MSKKQKIWLIFLIGFSVLHIIRDIFQDLGVKNILSTVLVKHDLKFSDIYWLVFNTYAFAIIEIVLSFTCLLRDKFDKIGRLTITVAASSVLAWLIYWFYLW